MRVGKEGDWRWKGRCSGSKGMFFGGGFKDGTLSVAGIFLGEKRG
jgi:hypothetical protein